MSETKEERFKRVAEKRVNRILESIRVLSNCSNRRMYSWNDSDLKKIWSAIEKELRNCKESFNIKQKERFKF
jgi:hypothetical protein